MRPMFLPLLALLLLLPAGAGAQGALSEVVDALEGPFRAGADRGAAIYDFEADFFQESRIASLERIQRGRGRVAVQFDRRAADRVPLARFRWDYEQPTTQEIVSDGRTLWVYLPENRQVIQSEIEQVALQRPDDPVTFLTGLGNLSRDFLITWASPNRDLEGNPVLELRPRRSSPMLERLLVVVAREAVDGGPRRISDKGAGPVFPILSTTVVDPGGNTTRIEFSKVRVNRGLSAGFFEFILPTGVEVVRPTGREMGF